MDQGRLGVPELGAGDVQLWWLPMATDTPKRLWDLLDEDETTRAGAFRSELMRSRFVACHAAARLVLGELLSVPPDALRFDRCCEHCGVRHGRPRLVDHADLAFNLSHSGDGALFGLTKVGQIGVDIEELRQRDLDGLLRFLEPSERAEIRGVETRHQLIAFLSCWTLKEAVAKGTGRGIAAFDGFTIHSFVSGRPTMTVPARESASEWTLLPLAPRPGYVGAMALAGKPERITCFRLLQQRRVQRTASFVRLGVVAS